MANKQKKKSGDIVDKTIITSIDGVLGKDKQKKGYLFFLSGPFLGKFFSLSEGDTILGRSPEADIVVEDSRISRKHLRIAVDETKVTVEDLKSTNGTFVNGERITVKELHPDDKIQVSPATIFKFSLADEDEKVAINELYELGVIDPLTNVYNKRYFIDRLKEEFSHARRVGASLSLVMVDVDFFKKINDTHGHLAGDYILTRLSRIFQAMTRQEDIVARYGGEEFAMVLRNTDTDGAELLSERIRSTVQAAEVMFEEKRINFTISVGIATLNEKSAFENVNDLINAADKALYYSKEHGRNRTTIYEVV